MIPPRPVPQRGPNGPRCHTLAPQCGRNGASMDSYPTLREALALAMKRVTVHRLEGDTPYPWRAEYQTPGGLPAGEVTVRTRTEAMTIAGAWRIAIAMKALGADQELTTSCVGTYQQRRREGRNHDWRRYVRRPRGM